MHYGFFYYYYLILGVASGPSQIFSWSQENPRDLPSSLPFVIDLSDNTFKYVYLFEIFKLIC